MAIGTQPTRKQISTGIFCLESWSGDLRTRRSVRPLLEILEQEAGLKFIHRVVDSKTAFFGLLARWPDYGGYRLGYIACHGSDEKIHIGRDSITLEQFKNEIVRREVSLARRTLYFGSCSVVRMPPRKLGEFRRAVGVEAVCGYRGADGVDWLESAAFELLLFDYLTYRHKRTPFGLRDFKDDHPALWKKLEFAADPIAAPPSSGQ